MKGIISSVIVITAATFLGCSEQAAQSSATKSDSHENVASLPDDLFLGQAPADAVPLHQVRNSSAAGDEVTFTGYIGGRSDPFTDGRAIFLIADSEEAPACGDECATPWDACCTPGEQIAANSATVQVTDSEGQIIKADLNGEGGLQPGSEVAITGTVREANDAILIVDASGIFSSPIQ